MATECTDRNLSLIRLQRVNLGYVQVPLSEMFNYVSNLRSMTKGRGQYVMQLGDYKQVPEKIQEEIVAALKVEA
jgi:translation elongation factor EF-G